MFLLMFMIHLSFLKETDLDMSHKKIENCNYIPHSVSDNNVQYQNNNNEFKY